MALLSDPRPALRDPFLLAAFEGWNDAGEAASIAVRHLTKVWGAQPLGELDPQTYYDFQVNRPRVDRDSNGLRRISWPTTRLYAATATSMGRDAILVHGIEPSTNWRGFVGEILSAARGLGVSQIVTLGALLADVPHTRPIPVSLTSEDEALQRRHGAVISDYEGPTGIIGVLADAAGQVGLAPLACWAAVPHYAGGPPSPKAALALLAQLERVLDVSIPQGELADAAAAWERSVDELAESDEEVAEYVQTLEQATDSADLGAPSGDEIAREFERYLRRRGDQQS